MAFKAIKDYIIVQEGSFGLSFIASGTINGGQLVKMAGPMQVVKTDDRDGNTVGVAAYYVTKGEAVTVYGPGNIVRLHTASGVSCGADIFAGDDGGTDDSTTYGGEFPSIGVALEAAISGSYRALLK